MVNAYPKRSTRPDVWEHPIRIQGAGTSNPTNEVAHGCTVTRTGTGAYRITWSENPGTFIAAVAGIQAATPGDIAGHTVVFDTWDATNLRLDFVLYNASDAAHDLAADEYIAVLAQFATSTAGA